MASTDAQTAGRPPSTDGGRHDLELRDVRDGRLVVSYNRVTHGRSHTEGAHVSDRLPLACLALFDGEGAIDVADLSAEERAWVEFEGDRIAFEEVASHV